MTIISDQTAIAKELARYFSGAYGSSTTSSFPGSAWNRQALRMNCVVVCIGYILNRHSDQLCYVSGTDQPKNGFQDWEAIDNYLSYLKNEGLVRDYLMTTKPFDYERSIGPGDDLVLYRRPGSGPEVKHCVLGSHHTDIISQIKYYRFDDFQHTKGGIKIWDGTNVNDEFKSESGTWDLSRIDYTVRVVPAINLKSWEVKAI